MSRYASTNDLVSRVYDYCNITTIPSFRSLVFKVLMCVRRRSADFAIAFLIVIHELYFSCNISYNDNFDNSMIKRESQRIHIELMKLSVKQRIYFK